MVKSTYTLGVVDGTKLRMVMTFLHYVRPKLIKHIPSIPVLLKIIEHMLAHNLHIHMVHGPSA